MDKLSIEEIAEWVNNDEGLYNWWKSERVGIRTFIRENRDLLTEIINARLRKEPGK